MPLFKILIWLVMRKLFGASCRELLTFLRLRVFGANLVTSLPPVLETAVHTLSVCRQACCQRTVWQCSMLSWWYPWLSPLLYRSKFWKQMISSLLSDSNRDRLWLWLWQRQLFLSCLELVKKLITLCPFLWLLRDKLARSDHCNIIIIKSYISLWGIKLCLFL